MIVPRFYHASVRGFYGRNGINPRRIGNARAAFSVNLAHASRNAGAVADGEPKQFGSVVLDSMRTAPMADNKNPNEKQPGEHAEGKYHYNPGNQAGKTVEDSEKEDNLDRVKNRAPAPHERT
jgi:hypothetical protein